MIDPSASQFSWDLLRDAAAFLATGLSTLCTFILYSFRSDIRALGQKISKLEENCVQVADLKEIGVRVEKIEADRSAIAVMAEQIKNVAKALEESTERNELHHVANLATMKLDRDETTRWRVETMTPLVQQLVADNLLNKERIEQLQKRRHK